MSGCFVFCFSAPWMTCLLVSEWMDKWVNEVVVGVALFLFYRTKVHLIIPFSNIRLTTMKTKYSRNMTTANPMFNFHLKMAIVRITNSSMTVVQCRVVSCSLRGQTKTASGVEKKT